MGNSTEWYQSIPWEHRNRTKERTVSPLDLEHDINTFVGTTGEGLIARSSSATPVSKNKALTDAGNRRYRFDKVAKVIPTVAADAPDRFDRPRRGSRKTNRQYMKENWLIAGIQEWYQTAIALDCEIPSSSC